MIKTWHDMSGDATVNLRIPASSWAEDAAKSTISHSSRECVGDLAHCYMDSHMQEKCKSQLKSERQCCSKLNGSLAMTASV